jgi:3-dehydroquinate synthase
MYSQLSATYENSNFPVIISNNCIKNISNYLKNYKKKDTILIVDEVFKNKNYHPSQEFSKLLKENTIFFCKAGIKKKNFKYILSIINFLNLKKISKNGLIVSIGGGVISDMVGFVASIYKRGLKLIHVPTTMTNMVDSCIGGKTGINYLNQVNLLGTYYHPIIIFIDIRFLKTLKIRDFKSGLVESIKKAFIADINFFNYMHNFSEKILDLSEEHLFEVINKSINQKIYLTSNDVKENSSRLLLNYGHTFGQALESYYKIDEKNLTHGEAVSLGMVSAAKMSEILYNDNKMLKIHYEILKSYGMPTKIDDMNLKKPTISKLCSYIYNDKKRKSETNRFIVCKKIGKAEIVDIDSKNLIKRSFSEIIN